MKRISLSLAVTVIVFMLLTACSSIGKKDEHGKYMYVNPFIGASTNTKDAGASHGLGKTIPGATSPFGLVQLSPNTITGGDNGSVISAIYAE